MRLRRPRAAASLLLATLLVAVTICVATSEATNLAQLNDSSSSSSSVNANASDKHDTNTPPMSDDQRRLLELRQKYTTNWAISDRAYYILLAVYALFILVGTTSNALICLTVSTSSVAPARARARTALQA